VLLLSRFVQASREKRRERNRQPNKKLIMIIVAPSSFKELIILFAPYFGLGVFTGLTAKGMWHLDSKGYAILAGVYLVFAAFGLFLATMTRNKDGTMRFGFRARLSPTGWGVGLALAHIAGVLVGLYQ
jgi:hypothetical protein